MLAAARLDAHGRDIKALLKLVMPLLSSTSRSIPWSSGERAGELHGLYAMFKRYGLSSDFITFSQYDPNEPFVIKIGSRICDNGKWKMPDRRTI